MNSADLVDSPGIPNSYIRLFTGNEGKEVFEQKVLELINSKEPKNGIYVIRKSKPVTRLYGKTDIMYIGKSDNKQGIQKRILKYWANSEIKEKRKPKKTYQRIRNAVIRLHDLEISIKIYTKGEKLREIEKGLIMQYSSDHGELPPLNRRI